MKNVQVIETFTTSERSNRKALFNELLSVIIKVQEADSISGNQYANMVKSKKRVDYAKSEREV